VELTDCTVLLIFLSDKGLSGQDTLWTAALGIFYFIDEQYILHIEIAAVE
jgi:hypothetical protein